MKRLSSGLLLVLLGCRSDREALVVFAAASLTDAFSQIESAFEASHPGTDVHLSFAGSSTLREQILEGAPADVFASAAPSHMEALVEAGAVAGETRELARNQMQIAVPAGNEAKIRGLTDFADPDRFIGLCAAEVPCGDAARQVLSRAGVEPRPDTDEPDVRALLTKIEEGELDAGIVYRSDVAAASGKIAGIDIPDDVNVETIYPIAVLAEARHSETARAFVAFALSGEGQAILARYGFLPPRAEPR